MYQCPINYYTDNLVFNQDKSCWAIYRLVGFNYDYLSSQGKINRLVQLAKVFSGIMSYAQIQILPIEKDINEHFHKLQDRLNKNDILYQSAISQIEKTKVYLNQNIEAAGQTNDYATYIIVKLSEAAEYEVVEQVSDIVQYVLKDPINAINVHMNLDTKDVLASKIKGYQNMANKWLADNKHRMGMASVGIAEAQWLFRRMAYRGTGKATKLFYKNINHDTWYPTVEYLDIEKEKIIRPYHKDIVNLFDGDITTEHRMLKVTTGFTTSYQTFIPITWLPDVDDFPGNEWIYALQKENLQAEVCIHIKVIPHKSALHRLDLKKREIESQIEHVNNAHADVPEDLYESKEYADAMEQELKEDRSPILESSITICLADTNKDALEEKCSKVKEIYEDKNIIIERPVSDQLKLYFSFIPSVRELVSDFTLRLTPITLASGMMGVTRELGDNRGGYIGTTGAEEKPVYFSPELASLLNMSPAIILLGDLGVGKSYNANILIYLMVLYGGYGLILDPKGERSHWETDLVALKGLINTVTLGADEEDKGKLDPYNVYRNNIKEGHELALNLISDLFGVDPKSDEYMVTLEAQSRMSKMVTGERPCMLKLADIMDSLPKEDDLCEAGKKLARRIKLQRENGMTGLLIGNGTESSIQLENRLNIIQLQNLTMPSPETAKDDYTREEVASVVCFGQVSAFVKKFAQVKRSVPKGVLIDESWAISATREGRSMEEYVSRMGRSLFTVIMYNGHSVNDLPTDGIRNSISHKFVFRSRNNEEEAKRLLTYLGLEITPDNMYTIANLKSGECFFKDLSGRVGILKFDVVFQDLHDVFSTTPKEGGEDEQPLEELDLPVPEEQDVLDMDYDYEFSMDELLEKETV